MPKSKCKCVRARAIITYLMHSLQQKTYTNRDLKARRRSDRISDADRQLILGQVISDVRCTSLLPISLHDFASVAHRSCEACQDLASSLVDSFDNLLSSASDFASDMSG